MRPWNTGRCRNTTCNRIVFLLSLVLCIGDIYSHSCCIQCRNFAPYFARSFRTILQDIFSAFTLIGHDLSLAAYLKSCSVLMRQSLLWSFPLLLQCLILMLQCRLALVRGDNSRVRMSSRLPSLFPIFRFRTFSWLIHPVVFTLSASLYCTLRKGYRHWCRYSNPAIGYNVPVCYWIM